MRLKIDLFTWGVIGVVVALVIAAVLTVNLADDSVIDLRTQLSGDSPAAPIVTAILAVQEGNVASARAQFTQDVLDEYEERGYDPISNAASFAANDQGSRRLRVIDVSAVQEGEDGETLAFVTLAEDTFSGGGLFGSSTWSNQRIIRVEQVDGVWLVDDPNLFY
jgi:hypothetical protein